MCGLNISGSDFTSFSSGIERSTIRLAILQDRLARQLSVSQRENERPPSAYQIALASMKAGADLHTQGFRGRGDRLSTPGGSSRTMERREEAVTGGLDLASAETR